MGDRVEGLWGEAFVYGLDERDTAGNPTPNRSYVAPGFRLYRSSKAGQWDVDLEAALRLGSRRATSDPDDTDDLNTEASTLFAALGYRFNAPWKPRFAAEYYYASGDADPDDDVFGQHERLFGARRSDLNNTSIHGPLTPANLSAPGWRMEVEPSERTDARVYYHAAFLASETDRWVIARLQDPTGQSGDFIGHTIDARARYVLGAGQRHARAWRVRFVLRRVCEISSEWAGRRSHALRLWPGDHYLLIDLTAKFLISRPLGRVRGAVFRLSKPPGVSCLPSSLWLVYPRPTAPACPRSPTSIWT